MRSQFKSPQPSRLIGKLIYGMCMYFALDMPIQSVLLYPSRLEISATQLQSTAIPLRITISVAPDYLALSGSTPFAMVDQSGSA